jgi:hypothetical protein
MENFMKTRKGYRVGVLIVMSLVFVFPMVLNAAQITTHFQGYLALPDGKPLNGTIDLEFNIYSVPEGGTAIWTENHTGVLVSNGIANVNIGGTTALSSELFQGVRYISAKIVGGEEVMARRQIISLFFAIKSKEAEQLHGSINAGSIAAGSIDSTQLNAQTFKGNKGVQGDIGNKGPVGPQGPQGPIGAPGTFYTVQ